MRASEICSSTTGRGGVYLKLKEPGMRSTRAGSETDTSTMAATV